MTPEVNDPQRLATHSWDPTIHTVLASGSRQSAVPETNFERTASAGLPVSSPARYYSSTAGIHSADSSEGVPYQSSLGRLESDLQALGVVDPYNPGPEQYISGEETEGLDPRKAILSSSQSFD